MTATGPTRVSMHELLASCAAADAISRPPERPEGARGTARPAATAPQPPDDLPRSPAERTAGRSAA
ncbi:hypothetical protein ABZX95_35700 [Streptomyces sp. NPDC004232]|uniref:hypothetical protein n=1 Tax=Streptomyces sp. NPDC004232 TaxID=3154454 RepID=UPI001D5330EC|nr:hypothetical protein [Streptomyces sp. tea 10]